MDTWGHNPAVDLVKEPDQSGTLGARLKAPLGGTVTRSEFQSGAGNFVEIKHGGGWWTVYMHLKSRSVSVGNKVTALSTTIGSVGKSGKNANGHPHLHFELRKTSASASKSNTGDRVPVYFNNKAYTGSSKTWRNVFSHNCTWAKPTKYAKYKVVTSTARRHWADTNSDLVETLKKGKTVTVGIDGTKKDAQGRTWRRTSGSGGPDGRGTWIRADHLKRA